MLNGGPLAGNALADYFSGYATVSPGTHQRFQIEVDWSGDGDFNDFHEDVTADVFAFETERGRDYASQLTGRSSAGRATLQLYNDAGKYSRFNSGSPLFGQLLPGRMVRIWSTGPYTRVLWAGYLESITPHAGPVQTATLTAFGAFWRLGGQVKVSPPALSIGKTSDAVDAVLNAAAWSARDIQVGNVEIQHWFIEGRQALDALQEIEDVEHGFLYEGLDFEIAFRSRYDRDVNHLTSEATFSDDSAAVVAYMADLVHGDPLREVFNEVTAEIAPRHVGDAAVLWTLSGNTPTIPSGGSLTFIATVGGDVAYVQDWETPVRGVDLVVIGVPEANIGVSVVPAARSLLITVINTSGVSGTISLLQARGVPVLSDDPFRVFTRDAASQASYGIRPYPLPSAYFNAAGAQATAELVIARAKDPHPVFEMSVPHVPAFVAQTIERDLSDRITLTATGPLTNFGINRDFYVEAIRHNYRAGEEMVTTFLLSEAAADPNYFVLGQDSLGGAAVLAY